MGVEDGLAALAAAVGGGGEVEEEGPGGADRADGGEVEIVGVVIWGEDLMLRGGKLRVTRGRRGSRTMAVEELVFGVAVDADVGVQTDRFATPEGVVSSHHPKQQR